MLRNRQFKGCSCSNTSKTHRTYLLLKHHSNTNTTKTSNFMKVAFLTKEFPPHVYGGAGVHVEYLAKFLAELMQVEVRCFGDQDITGEQLSVHGYDFKDSFFEFNVITTFVPSLLLLIYKISTILYFIYYLVKHFDKDVLSLVHILYY